VNTFKKAYISLLMSGFLILGIAALAYIGVFDFRNFLTMPNSVKAVAFVLIFFALFLFGFFLFNIKRSSSMKKKTAAGVSTGTGSIAGTGNTAGVTRHQGGLLATASRLSPSSGFDEISRRDVIYEKNGIPYINSDLVRDLAKKNIQVTLDRSFIKLVESVTNAACSATAGQAVEGS